MTQLPGFPDFFVVGAPRCGTTALCRYLSHNPQICFSRPKEPHYFSQVGALPSERELQTDYIARYFGDRGPGQRIAGEGSVSYLYLPGVIERIRHFNPDARFIVMLRNPMSMLPSYHLKMQFMLAEDEADFAKAWRQQDARARGESLPRHCLDARLLMYREVASFGRQLERLYDLAGRNRTHVIVFDDFVADTLATYRGALDFLGVDYDGRTRFVPRNESRTYRYRWLQHLLYMRAARGGVRMNTAQRVERKLKLSGSEEGELGSDAGGMEQDSGIAHAAHAGNARRRRRDLASRCRAAIPAAEQGHGLLVRRACLSLRFCCRIRALPCYTRRMRGGLPIRRITECGITKSVSSSIRTRASRCPRWSSATRASSPRATARCTASRTGAGASWRIPLAKVHKAHYVLMNIECDSETIAELEHSFRFNDAVLRHLTVKMTKAVVDPSPMMKEEKSRSMMGEAKPGEARRRRRLRPAAAPRRAPAA